MCVVTSLSPVLVPCRNLGYDGNSGTDLYLNQTHVKGHLGADMTIPWVACSAEVDRIMGHDVMKSVKHLVVDVLEYHPVLL